MTSPIRLTTQKLQVRKIDSWPGGTHTDFGSFNLNLSAFTIFDTKGIQGINNLQDVINKFGTYATVVSLNMSVTGTGPRHDCYMKLILSLITGTTSRQIWTQGTDAPQEAENFSRTVNMYTGRITTIPTSYKFNNTCTGSGCGCTQGNYLNIICNAEITIDINLSGFCLQNPTDINCIPKGYSGPNIIEVVTDNQQVYPTSDATSTTADGNWGNFTLPGLSTFTLDDPQNTGRFINVQQLIDLVGIQNINVKSLNMTVNGSYGGHDCNLYLNLNLVNSYKNENIFTSTYNPSMGVTENINKSLSMYTGELNNLPNSYNFNNTCSGVGCGCNRGNYSNITVNASLVLQIKLIDFCTSQNLSKRLCGGTGPAIIFPSPGPAPAPAPAPAPTPAPTPTPTPSPSPSPSPSPAPGPGPSPSPSPSPAPAPGPGPAPAPGPGPSPSPSPVPGPSPSPSPAPAPAPAPSPKPAPAPSPLIIGLSVGGGILLLLILIGVGIFAFSGKKSPPMPYPNPYQRF
jgi:hypothetical protein